MTMPTFMATGRPPTEARELRGDNGVQPDADRAIQLELACMIADVGEPLQTAAAKGGNSSGTLN